MQTLLAEDTMKPTTQRLTAIAVLAAVCLTLANATAYTTHCRAPPLVDNGGHNGTNSNLFLRGSVITYWCDDGYSLHGSSRRTCSYSRPMRTYQWNGSAPTCICKSNSRSYILMISVWQIGVTIIITN